MDKTSQFNSVRFFKSLYKDCDGYLNIRILPRGENLFIPQSEIGSMIPKIKKQFKEEDIYYAVATRRERDGTKEGIIKIPALWGDIDSNGRPLKDLWKKVINFPLKPSAILKSGGGYHPYWFLQIPATKDQIPEIE